MVQNVWHTSYLGVGDTLKDTPTSLPLTPTFPTKGCLAQHFLHGFPVALFQDLLSAPGPYKGSFDAKFEAK